MKAVNSREKSAYIKKHWKKEDDRTLAKKLGLSLEAVQQRRKRMYLQRPKRASEPAPLEEELAERSEKRNRSQEQKRHNQLLALNERLQRERDAAAHLSSKPIEKLVIRASSSLKGEATIVALLSDMRIEETVKRETVNGLSEYSLEIAQRRMKQYFTTLLHLIQIEQQATKIDHLVLALLGDAISGDIHEELLETCSLAPMEATVLVQTWIASGIDYPLQNSKLKMPIVYHSGNHARTTKKVRPSTEPGHSVEFLMYHNLRWHYEGQSRITWMIPKAISRICRSMM